jgi:hypothetical protein
VWCHAGKKLAGRNKARANRRAVLTILDADQKMGTFYVLTPTQNDRSSCDEYGKDIVRRGFPSDSQFFPHRQIPK